MYHTLQSAAGLPSHLSSVSLSLTMPYSCSPPPNISALASSLHQPHTMNMKTHSDSAKGVPGEEGRRSPTILTQSPSQTGNRSTALNSTLWTPHSINMQTTQRQRQWQLAEFHSFEKKSSTSYTRNKLLLYKEETSSIAPFWFVPSNYSEDVSQTGVDLLIHLKLAPRSSPQVSLKPGLLQAALHLDSFN